MIADKLEALADELADYAYNRMQKSEAANNVFDLAQKCRRIAQRLAA